MLWHRHKHPSSRGTFAHPPRMSAHNDGGFARVCKKLNGEHFSSRKLTSCQPQVNRGFCSTADLNGNSFVRACKKMCKGIPSMQGVDVVVCIHSASRNEKNCSFCSTLDILGMKRVPGHPWDAKALQGFNLFRLFVLTGKCSGDVSSMLWRVRGRIVPLANNSDGNSPAQRPPANRRAPRRDMPVVCPRFGVDRLRTDIGFRSNKIQTLCPNRNNHTKQNGRCKTPLIYVEQFPGCWRLRLRESEILQGKGFKEIRMVKYWTFLAWKRFTEAKKASFHWSATRKKRFSSL